MSRKGFGVLGIVLIVAAVLIIGGGAWYYLHRQGSSTSQNVTGTDQSYVDALPGGPANEPGWKTYTYQNGTYSFSFEYPSGFLVGAEGSPYVYPVGASNNSNDLLSFDPNTRSSNESLSSFIHSDEVAPALLYDQTSTVNGIATYEFASAVNNPQLLNAKVFFLADQYDGVDANYELSSPNVSIYGKILSTFKFTWPITVATTSTPGAWPSLAVGPVTLNIPPAFASVATLETGDISTDTYNDTDYDISAFPTNGGIPLPDAFIVSADPNPTHLSFNDWFEANIDSDGLLKSSGYFKLVSYPDGKQAFIWTGMPYPAGWNGGLIMNYAFLMFPSSSSVVSFSGSMNENVGTIPGYTSNSAQLTLDRSLVDNMTANN